MNWNSNYLIPKFLKSFIDQILKCKLEKKLNY